MVPERLPLVYVADVDFDKRYVHAQKRVTQGYTCMGQRTRVDLTWRDQVSTVLDQGRVTY